jgi:hypothetical protein
METDPVFPSREDARHEAVERLSPRDPAYTGVVRKVPGAAAPRLLVGSKSRHPIALLIHLE